MGCNCGRRKKAPPPVKSPIIQSVENLLDAYKYLKPHQIKARLEIFKRNFCKACKDRYKCDYDMYLKCTVRPQARR